jgi:hypothetical protein
MNKHRQDQEDPLKVSEEDFKGSQASKASTINLEEQRAKDRVRGKDKGRALETYLRSLRRSLEAREVREVVDLSKHNRQREETSW